MSFVTVAELERYLIENDFAKNANVRQLIQDQHLAFDAVRQEIAAAAAAAEQARGQASTFETKFDESLARIQEIEAKVIQSQSDLLAGT